MPVLPVESLMAPLLSKVSQGDDKLYGHRGALNAEQIYAYI